MPEDITKLPQWAQRKISVLKQTLRDAQRDSLNNWTPRWEGDEPLVFLREMVGHRLVDRPIGGQYTSVVFRDGPGKDANQVEVGIPLNGKLCIFVRARDLAFSPAAGNMGYLSGKEQ